MSRPWQSSVNTGSATDTARRQASGRFTDARRATTPDTMPSGTAERLVDGHADGALSTRLPPETLFHYVHPCAFVEACFFAPLMKRSETWNGSFSTQLFARRCVSHCYCSLTESLTSHLHSTIVMTLNYHYTRDLLLSTEMLREE